MLILTRYPRESIVITPTSACRIEISIVRVCDDKVHLGIVAPKTVEVHRKEIQLLIDKEKGVTNGVVTNMPSQAH